MTGYTQDELDDIQAKWSLRFPPDLVALYRERRLVIDHPEHAYMNSFDWLTEPDKKIRDALDWPLEGFLFDVAHGLWWPEWGGMPETLPERREKFLAIFAEAPKLIPISGHRCIPETPHEAGNPVFSVWQMDVICYGADLAHYIRHEMLTDWDAEADWPPIKTIPFWSRAVAFNNERFASGRGFAFFNKDGVLPTT
jgi:hypothetical protein